MKLAVVSSRAAKLETWCLYLDHGSFLLAGGEQELEGLDPLPGKWKMGRGGPASAGTAIIQRASFLSSLPHSFCLLLFLLLKRGCHNVVQARLKLAM